MAELKKSLVEVTRVLLFDRNLMDLDWVMIEMKILDLKEI
jgi:hypothetical protein